jgi:hypothetical protein
MFGLNKLSVNSQGTGSGGVFLASTLTEAVLDSDANSFTVGNVVKNSVRINFLVAADVKNSDADDFTVFT